MRFVLNTKFLKTPSSLVCIEGLYQLLIKNGYKAAINDWEHYDQYDYAIFMAYDSQIHKARQQNPKIKIGLSDPKPNSVKDALAADFLLVSSIEQRELFLKYNNNIFIYYMIPEFEFYSIDYKEKDKIVIGYHGNKIHLNTFYNHITPALNKIGNRYNIELHAIYNIKHLGKWTIGRPDERKCKVKDLQWYEDCYKDYFKDIDIGIVPNIYPLEKDRFIKKYCTTAKYFFSETESDHLVKYKFSSNAGRIFVFGMFGIPVVSEAVPSSGDIIRDGYSGKLVLYSHGWYSALEEMIKSCDLRKIYGRNLKNFLSDNYSRDIIFKNFISFLNTLKPTESIDLTGKKPFFLLEMGMDLIRKVKKKIKKV